MNALEKFYLPFFQKHLRKKLKTQNRRRITNNFWTARNIAIIFDADHESDRNELLDFGKALEKDGRKINVLGYFHQKKLEFTPKFDFFTKKMVNLNGEIKDKTNLKFGNEKLDLLLVFNPNARWPLENLAVSLNAATKIGNHTPHPNDFDMMLELPKDSSAKFFLEQLDIYLDKIIVPANESVFAKI